MKTCTKLVLTSFSLLAISSAANAFDNPQHYTDNSDVQACYGFAMIGMDSVINSRLGVPAEHALDLARMTHVSAQGDPTYSMELLNNILNAYSWQDSPHSYAINMFYQCAQRHRPLRSAAVEP